ncbi:hypothetical protein [Desulfosporosinus sp. BG]|nr:hypothetical protein [Desulfosporosinus sp. BG]ODA42833.1 hypothetical protein DSBG_0451 [Desulfosporosinus sp. BG]
MKKTGETQKHTKGLASAKYDSRSAEFKQAQKKAKGDNVTSENEG